MEVSTLRLGTYLWVTDADFKYAIFYKIRIVSWFIIQITFYTLSYSEKEMTMDNPTTNPVEKKDLVMSRVFNATVEQVWKAWSDPQDVMRWWGPTGFTCPLVKIDFREGGTSLLAMRPPKEFGDQDLYSTWMYQKIVPIEQIEYIHNLADQDGQKIDPVTINMPADFPQNQLHTITFKVLGANETELTVTEHGWPVGQMMQMSEMGMNQCLDKMAALFIL